MRLFAIETEGKPVRVLDVLQLLATGVLVVGRVAKSLSRKVCQDQILALAGLQPSQTQRWRK
jgi:hypothetical protein